TGHGDLVEAHDGSWWMVFLGIRPNNRWMHYHTLGRETFLAPVKWGNGGWPVVGDGGKVSLEMEAEGAFCAESAAQDVRAEKVIDDFDGDQLGLEWNFLRNPYRQDWSVNERKGCLALRGSQINLDDIDSPAFVGRRQKHFNCTATTLIDFKPLKEGEEAGLSVYMDERHHYEIAIVLISGRRNIIVRKRVGSLASIAAREEIDDKDVILRIESAPERYHFSYKTKDESFKRIAEGESRYLSSEVTGGFTGTYLVLYATGNGKRSSSVAYFDWFEYQAEDEA
ncbi:MAG: family 43 glycosylhydrolase, partial [Candidatus Omnitrophica bacterium]|nr:family 43 glycosylhydrolase [Candidatus Omnitrophota bacterium]